jgi:hypothetical protein
MSHTQIAGAWLKSEARRRPQFKQPIQDLEHGGGIGQKHAIEDYIAARLKTSGNPWGIDIEDVNKDLFAADYARMDGYKQMVWTVGHSTATTGCPKIP